MKKIAIYPLLLVWLLCSCAGKGSFRPGEIWPDNNGVHINAHGGGILQQGDTYYWFGEHKTEGKAGNVAQVGVHCYSSKDLYNWKDEGIALSVSDDESSPIVKGCILERPKVIFNKKTGKYVMWFHLEPKGAGYSGAQSGVAVSDKPDSQDFYTGDINDILQTIPHPGNFVNAAGKILGKHRGIWNYTVGQRRGLGIGADRPLYVIRLDKEKNEVVLGYEDECCKPSLIAEDINWLSIPPLTAPATVKVRLRSSQTPAEAELLPLSGKTAEVRFAVPQKAVAAGQSAVFYDEQGFVLGGGFIRGEENGAG